MPDDIRKPAKESVSLKDIFNAIERLQAEGFEWTAPAIKAASGYDLLPVEHICNVNDDGGASLQTIFTLANSATKEAAQIFFFQSGEPGAIEIGREGTAELHRARLSPPPATLTETMPLMDYLRATKPKP